MPGSGQLREALRQELAAELSPHGWSVTEPGSSEAVLDLARTLDSGLDATVTLGRPTGTFSFGKRPEGWDLVVVSGIWVGVGYGPLRELSPLTCAYELDVQRSRVFADGELGLFLRGDERFGSERPPEFEFHAHAPAQVGPVARRLADIVVEHGTRIAELYADVDELIEALPGLTAGALLAADGRFEEASAVLTGLDHEPTWWEDRRSLYQLRRWVASGGDRSLLPAEPPPARRPRSEPPRGERLSFSEAKRRAREQRATREAALQAARERGAGLSLDRQREILAQEFDGHGIESGPIDLELSLVHLWDTDADKWANLGRGVVALGRFGFKAFRAMRGNEEIEEELEERFDREDQLDAPDPAFFEVPLAGVSVGVELHDGLQATLGEIHELTWPHMMGTGSLREAWLKPGDDGRITVHAGGWEIGMIPAADAPAFDQAMQAAAFRAEFPRLPARIGRFEKPLRYVVEVSRPVAW